LEKKHILIPFCSVHIVNIVTFPDGSRYVVDSAFGGDGATKPLPLIKHHITRNLGTQEVRFDYDQVPNLQFRRKDLHQQQQKLWVYQYRNQPEQPWNSFYCFSDEIEFTHADFRVMNFFTSEHPESFQQFNVLIVKFLQRDGQIYGKRMLVNADIKQNLGGKTEVIRTCKTEEERVQALQEFFAMTLTEEERIGIRGRVTELRGE
jgi:arylamine N-acetyltransferase